jgi:hypothetical protein
LFERQAGIGRMTERQMDRVKEKVSSFPETFFAFDLVFILILVYQSLLISYIFDFLVMGGWVGGWPV